MSNKKSEEAIIKAFQKYMENGKSVLPVAQQGTWSFKQASMDAVKAENLAKQSKLPGMQGYIPLTTTLANNPFPQQNPYNPFQPVQPMEPLVRTPKTRVSKPTSSVATPINTAPTITTPTMGGFNSFEAIGSGSEIPENIGYSPNLPANNWGFGNGEGYAPKDYSGEFASNNQLPNNIIDPKIGYSPKDYSDTSEDSTSRDLNNNEYDQWKKENINISGDIQNGAALNYGLYEFGQGNNLKGTLGVAKGALGTLRDGLSAFSTGKANKYAKDQYQEKQYGTSNNIYKNLQEGGEAIQEAPVQSEDPQAAQQQQIMQQVAQMLQQGTAPEAVLQKLVEMGMPQEQAQQILQQVIQTIQAEQAPQEQVPEGQQVMQQGGKTGSKITGSEALTGEYTTEDTPSPENNVNIEKNEWIKNNETGEISKAIGNTHKNGGMDVNLKDAKIISNFTKLGAENAKFFSKTFDLKLGATDTFAKVIDSYTKKSGLNKLTEEEVKLTDKMGDILTVDNPDLNSQDLNAKFLTGKMQEVLAKKEPLKEKRNVIFEEVFKRQEAIPKKGNGELIMQEGGEIDPILQKLALEYGITPERAKELTEAQKDPLKRGKNSGIDKNDKLTQAEQRIRLQTFISDAKSKGYEGDADYNAKDLNAENAKIQKWMSETNPQGVVDYFTTNGQPFTAKHIDILKSRFPETFKASGINPSKPSASYTNEEKLKLQTQAGSNIDQNFLTEGYQDGLLDWRGVLQGTSGLKPVGISKQTISAPGIPNYYQPEEKLVEEEVDPVVAIAKEQNKTKSPSGGGYDFGFQPIYIPPSAIQPVYKANSVAPDVEWIKMTAEPNLVEAERQRVAAQGRYQGLSPEVAAAMTGQDFAQTQMTTNTAISNAEAVNQQAENAGRAQQAAYDFKSDMVNANYANQYEQKVFGGQNAYEQALQNYYNKAYNEPGQLAELNKNKAAAYNSMNENYKVGKGNVEFNATELEFYNGLASDLKTGFAAKTPEERKALMEEQKYNKGLKESKNK